LGITVDENLEENFLQALSTVSDDPDTGVLDFASFLKIMGLKGSNDDYLDVELEDHRRRLLEALTTFHTFDEDGGGTIDALEVKATMRAMGQKVRKRQSESRLCRNISYGLERASSVVSSWHYSLFPFDSSPSSRRVFRFRCTLCRIFFTERDDLFLSRFRMRNWQP
jgi:hypothetical protein